MYLKRHVRTKDGKRHVYYSLTESIRLSRRRVRQRRVLNLGELNTTQLEQWQRSIEVLEENGQRLQRRLFTDAESSAPAAPDVCEVLLGSLSVRRPRQFGECWLGCRLFEELQLDQFFSAHLAHHRGPEDWAKVVELLSVNRLCAPGSELSVHERWFDRTAMDVLLEADPAIAGKDRLYRTLDKIVALKGPLEQHLAQRWAHLFNAQFDILLYDLTSTYFEGAAEGVPRAARGYSRDHRPDCRQIVLALVVTSDGFPLSYEVFDGNRNDVTTLDHIVDTVRQRHGATGRVWVFDRGIVSEENLDRLRQRGDSYLVGTPRHRLDDFERELLGGRWETIAQRPGVKVKLIREGDEVFVLARSVDRAKKESAMRRRLLRGLAEDLKGLQRSVRLGRAGSPERIQQRLGKLEERWSRVWPLIRGLKVEGRELSWRWDVKRLKGLARRDGAYLLRSNLEPLSVDLLWRQYVQLTEVEEAFRVLKSELNLRPVWHRTGPRVEAHVMVAFLGYCLWVCLKHKLRAAAPSLTPARVLEALGGMMMVEVWFRLRDGRNLCLPRYTQPEPEQALILHLLGWELPEQPPPRIHAKDLPN